MTNFGVESTVREAWQHDYAVLVVEDACTGFSVELHRFSVENILPHLSRVCSTQQLVAALASRPKS